MTGMHSKIFATIWTKPTWCWIGTISVKFRVCARGHPDLVICDQCLYVAFLEHFINFMQLFSSKCLWHNEKEAYHNRSKETLIQQHLFKAGSFHNPRDKPFQCKIYHDLNTGPITSPTTPIWAVMIYASSLSKLLGDDISGSKDTY